MKDIDKIHIDIETPGSLNFIYYDCQTLVKVPKIKKLQINEAIFWVLPQCSVELSTTFWLQLELQDYFRIFQFCRNLWFFTLSEISNELIFILLCFLLLLRSQWRMNNIKFCDKYFPPEKQLDNTFIYNSARNLRGGKPLTGIETQICKYIDFLKNFLRSTNSNATWIASHHEDSRKKKVDQQLVDREVNPDLIFTINIVQF